MGHMINRQSHAFECNSGNNCTRNRLNCTRLRLVQLAVARAIIPELHSKACDYTYTNNKSTGNSGTRTTKVYIKQFAAEKGATRNNKTTKCEYM